MQTEQHTVPMAGLVVHEIERHCAGKANPLSGVLSKRAELGFDYVHSLVDDRSRLAYSETLPDEKGPTCAAFLRRAAAYFTAMASAPSRG